MILRRIKPLLQLQPYIDTLWVFENDHGIPVEDSRVIAPNGKAKFIYSYLNGLSTIDEGVRTNYNDQDIFLIGVWDKPVTLTSHERATGTIGIELTPNGLHRFTRFPASEITNKIYRFGDIYGRVGSELIEKLCNTVEVDAKIQLLQRFLANIVELTSRHNKLIDYSVTLINHSSGMITIKDLEHKMGYSRRYLDMMFMEHMGISPKSYSSIVRFQSFYNQWANSIDADFYSAHLYDRYYDQAHFIKEFKKFTGHAPKQYARLKNDFGKIFYRDH